MELTKDESAANLALLWPKERWPSVIPPVLDVLSARNKPTSTMQDLATPVEGFEQQQAVHEFVDVISFVELACLFGWAKPQDFPIGFLGLAVSLLLSSQSSSCLGNRGPNVLPSLALFRLKGGGFVIASADEPVASRSEDHLRAFDSLLEDIRSTLFDSDLRQSFGTLRLAPQQEHECEHPSLGHFLQFAGRLRPAVQGLHASGSLGPLLASSCWHLFFSWLERARRNRHLFVPSDQTSLEGKTEKHQVRLVNRDLQIRDQAIRAGIALVEDGQRLYAAPAAEYADRIKSRCGWL